MLVDRAVVLHLFSIYGSCAVQVLALVDQAPVLAAPIIPNLLDIKAQVVYAVQAEQAHTLMDICLRRTLLGMQTNYGFDVLPQVTAILQEYCGWSQTRCDRQIQQYHRYIECNSLPDWAMAASASSKTA